MTGRYVLTPYGCYAWRGVPRRFVKRAVRDHVMPYGRWTEPDGTEVLFNRKYEPLWRRVPGQSPTPAGREERIPFAGQEWFYDDRTPLAASQHAAEAVLRAWGLPIPSTADLPPEFSA